MANLDSFMKFHRELAEQIVKGKAMTRDEVIALMASSKSEDEWNANCDKIKKACGGDYPDFWWTTIMVSGLADVIVSGFGK